MSEFTQKVRYAVGFARSEEVEECVFDKIQWSRNTIGRSRLARWFYDLPDHEYTREEALKLIKTRSEFGGSDYDYCMSKWSTTIDVCKAIEYAEKHNLPLKLTVEQVNLLEKWA